MPSVLPKTPPNMPEQELAELLPPVFAKRLTSALSPPAIYRLIQAFPGARMRIPAKPDQNHRLAVALTMSELASLCRRFRGSILEIPTGSRLKAGLLYRQVVALAADGLSVSEIARRTGLTMRWVRVLLNARREAGQQDAGAVALAHNPPL
jgi:hypothetical protein